MSDALWPRLQERWSALCPDLPRGGLNPPATARQIDAVETLTGIRLPDDLRDAYLHFNGMQRQVIWNNGLRAPQLILNQFHWLDLETMATRWTSDRGMEAGSDFDPDLFGPEEVHGDEVRHLQYHAAWLPIGHSGTSVQCLADMGPSRWGRPGQIVSYDSVDMPGVMAPSFADIVHVVLDAFDRGAVEWNGWEIVSHATGHPLYGIEAWQLA